jgi:uncharacterized membrane protein YtjA (UPF0391 family)
VVCGFRQRRSRVARFNGSVNRSEVEQEFIMLRYALIFLVIALLASAFGMFALSGVAMEAARIVFFVFLVLLVISLISGRRGMSL